MPYLGVNIDHIATLRQARRGPVPDILMAAQICISQGADSIVAHLREDRRHIQDKDIFLLRRALKAKLNMEMSIAPGIVEIALKTRPDQATLVPERRMELTTEGGLDVAANFKDIKETVCILEDAGIKTSLFIDTDKKQIDAARKTGASIIELHTGRYADAKNKKDQDKYFHKILFGAKYAAKCGLIVNAGHGLDYENVFRIAKIEEINELNIGYSIICRSVFTGLGKAVKEMKDLIL